MAAPERRGLPPPGQAERRQRGRLWRRLDRVLAPTVWLSGRLSFSAKYLLVGGVMLAGLAVMVLSVPVLMATWFAPALVFFHNMQPVDAMKASFAACAANVLPLTIYSLLLLPMFFFAMLPLGMGLLVLIPVFAGALYASYRDIFPGT